MHSTQIFILTELADSDGLRYTDMRPPTMEASKFMYHLKTLITAGLVIKKDNLYLLSSKGSRYVDSFDEDKLAPFSHPRVTMMMIYIHSQNGPLLMWRDQQPARGTIGFLVQDIPIDYQEPLTEFASQRFSDLAGINAHYNHVGDGYVRLLNEGNLAGNMLAHVMVAVGAELPHKKDHFVWLNDSPPESILPSVTYILNLVNTENDHFFFEYEMSL